jgi:hypothetical protein
VEGDVKATEENLELDGQSVKVRRLEDLSFNELYNFTGRTWPITCAKRPCVYVGRGLLVNSIGRRLGNTVVEVPPRKGWTLFSRTVPSILGENDPVIYNSTATGPNRRF